MFLRKARSKLNETRQEYKNHLIVHLKIASMKFKNSIFAVWKQIDRKK